MKLGKQETKSRTQAIIKSIKQNRMIANKKVREKQRQKNARNQTKMKACMQETKKRRWQGESKNKRKKKVKVK